MRVEFSKLAAKQRVRAWVRLVALTAAQPDRRWRAVTVGRGARGGVAAAEAGPLDPARARGILADLVALHREGLREPLPLPTVAAHVYARTRSGWRQRRRRAGRGAARLVRGPVPGARRGGLRPRLRRRGRARGAHRVAARAASPPGSATSRCGCGAPCSPRRCCDDGRVERLGPHRPTAFDVCGELPTGTTVLEASAGTGKTFTIAALAARYVAEGHARLPELLLVTFGREATQELRERVRERLVSAERGLRDPAAARTGTDPVAALLADVPDAEAAVRRRRLTAALAEFDAATIATTHQFCGQMLTALGIAGDAADAVFVESVDDLVVEVVDDFYVRKFAAKGAGTPAFDRTEALRLARRAVGDPQARLEPAGASGTAAVRLSFATAVRGEVERRKRARGLHTYDDLVTRLHDALGDPVREAAQRLRSRYRVVLVDEFQDTDPLQWGILRHFAGHVPLVLIGDPKQAIYAFRGADVVSYLDAVGQADTHATLARNWRSDAGLLRALDTVFGGAALGDARIVVREVESAHPVPRLAGAPVDTPLRVRVLPRDGLACSGRGLVLTPKARALVARDVAADVTALLSSGATTAGDPLRPGDVAVLVRTNDQGTVMRDALAAVGVPAVLSGTASVFGTPAAREWLTLLHALEQPRPIRIRDAALTCFLGRTVAELCGADGTTGAGPTGTAPTRTPCSTSSARRCAAGRRCCTARASPRCWRRSPPAPACPGGCSAWRTGSGGSPMSGTSGRPCTPPPSTRTSARRRWSSGCATASTRPRRTWGSNAAGGSTPTPRPCRSSPCTAARAWSSRWCTCRSGGTATCPASRTSPSCTTTPARACWTSAGPGGPSWSEHCARHEAEEAGEDLRLLYVALTRARCQVVAWWVPATTTPTSPLHRLLFGRRGPGATPPASCPVPNDTAALTALRGLTGADLAVEQVRDRPPVSFTTVGAAPEALAAARFTRTLDLAWRRTSYSALTAGVHGGHAGVVTEPEVREKDDEGPAPDADDGRDDGALGSVAAGAGRSSDGRHRPGRR